MIKENGYIAAAKCVHCDWQLKSGQAGKIVGRDVQNAAHHHAEISDHPVQIEVSYIAVFKKKDKPQTCRTCGCTDGNACIVLPENIDPPEYGATTCYWVEPDLCSACARKEDKEVITA